MTGVVKTKENITGNYNPRNKQSRIYVNRLNDARSSYNDWNVKDELYWSKYQIKETDMRVKTATFTSDTYLDLTTGLYCVLITSPFHEDFGGIILSVEEDRDKGLYNYQCQDFTRQYQQKWELVLKNVTLHRLIKHIITGGSIPLNGEITDAMKKTWKTDLSGLRPAYQYDQEFWNPSIKNFNPMTQTFSSTIKGKSGIEIIRDYVFGTGAYIDVYPNKYGILQIEPYHKTDWLKSILEVSYEEIMDMKVSFNTTNIVTGVAVQNSDQLSTGKVYDSKTVTGLDLSVIYGLNEATISDPNPKTTTTTNTKKTTTTTSTSKKNSGNPYKTKKKRIYLNSDNIDGKSTDKAFLNNIAKALKKQGWSTKVIGVGPNTHTEKYMKGCTDGVWFCVYGGADGAVFKECAGKNSYTNTLKKNNLRTVIGMKKGCDIRKGGKCYKYLKRAHDDNYSPASYKGVSYPLNMLTKAKVPIMYAGTVDKMVAKFLKGGDNPKAC